MEQDRMKLIVYTVCLSLLVTLCTCLPNISLRECQRTHRAHPESKTKFQMLDGKFWIEVDCGFLVWNQSVCQCTYSKSIQGDDCSDFVKGDAPGLYKRWNGLIWVLNDCNHFMSRNTMIWSQEKCICDWDTDGPKMAILPKHEVPAKCLVMLNITFDVGFLDDARGSCIDRRNPLNSQLVKDPTAVGDQAACFNEAPMLSPYFSKNSLTDIFEISFNFKICQNMTKDERLQTILHNSCYIENEGVISPTISLSFQPRNGLFFIDMDTEYSIIPTTDSCTVDLDLSRWNRVKMQYQNGMLTLAVNYKICLNSRFFKGRVKRFKCPLIFPGEDYCGCFDEVVVTRGCRQ